jgi:hypothetical protein
MARHGLGLGLAALLLLACSDGDSTAATTTAAGASGGSGGAGAGATGGAPQGGEAQGGQAQGGEAAGAAGQGGAPPATQLTLLDVTYEHNTETMAFSFLPVPAEIPADLTSPVSYATGQLHERLEVITKPSAQAVSYQLCIFQDEQTADNHACASYFTFSAVGTVETDEPLADIWQYGVIEWDRALLNLMLTVKDVDGNPVDTRYGFDGLWAGSPDLGLYYPMQVRFSAVLVPPGASFEGFPP